MRNILLLLLSVFAINLAFAQDIPEEVAEEQEVTVFMVVENMPIFSKDCLSESSDETIDCTNKKVQEYVSQVDYPQEAIDKDIEGKVFVSFTVEKDGSIGDVMLLRGVDPLLDNAALDHIKNMPAFYKPGFQRGKEVRVKYNFPIVFKLGGGYNALTKKEMK